MSLTSAGAATGALPLSFSIGCSTAKSDCGNASADKGIGAVGAVGAACSNPESLAVGSAG